MKSSAALHAAEEAARLWALPGARLLPFQHGHGAQCLVRSAQGEEWVLKRARVENGALDEFDAILAMIAALGGHIAPAAFPELRPTPDGFFVRELDGERYYMMRRVEGRRPTYRSLEDSTRALEALAAYHAHAAEAAAALRAKLKMRKSKTVESIWAPSARQWEELDARIARRGAKIGWLGRRFLGRHESMRWFYEQSQRCIESLGSNAALPIGLTHGDTHANNFLLARDCVWLLDIESYAWRPPVLDLVIPASYCARFHGWRADSMERALERYEAIRPLDAAERRVLGAMLIFPRQWVRGMTALLRSGGKFSTGPYRNLWEASRGAKAKRQFALYVLRQW